MTDVATDTSCEYVHDIDGGVWECPHPKVEGETHCVFHGDPSSMDPATVRAAFRSATHDPPERWAFLGATLPTLDLRHVLVDLDNRETVDLRDATIDGDLLLEYVTVRQPLDLSGATVTGDVHAFNFDIESELTCRGLECEGDLDFHESGFSKNVTFDGATVGGNLRFEFARFDGQVSFDGVTVGGETDLHGATVRRGVSFDGSRFGRRVHLSGTRYPRLEMAPAETPDDGVVDLRDCEVERGRIEMGSDPDGAVPLYDLTDTTLGDVVFTSPDESVFTHLRLRRTTYDGFDFGDYRPELRRTWYRIHEEENERTAADGGVPDEASAGVEQVYENASAGARAAGYPEVARQFTFKKRQFERRRHFGEMRGAERLSERVDASNRWLLNWIENVVTGYGERPARALFTSVTVTIWYGVAYSSLSPNEPLTSGLTTSSTVLVSFLLGMPDAYEEAGESLRVLMQTEAILGFVLVGVILVSMVTDRVT